MVTDWLAKPTMADPRKAQQKARSDLKEMGRWTRDQRIIAAVFVLLLVLWIWRPNDMDAGLAAWIGVSILIVTRTERWENIIANAKTWDTLFWLGVGLPWWKFLGWVEMAEKM